jgi:predicted flap endonuclease-1-like 5' DNA nuclease
MRVVIMTPEDWITLAGVALIGLVLGWLIRDRVYRRQDSLSPNGRASKARRPRDISRSRIEEIREQVEKVEAALTERQQAVERHETDLAKANAELSRREREIETLRNRLEKREREHTTLLGELGERRARMTEAGADLYRLSQELIRREEALSDSMETVAERGQELELLTQIDAGFQADMDSLTQEIQLQDGEIARLWSVLEGKQTELAEARTLLAQRETELARIIRSREEADREIEEALQELGQARREIEHAGEASRQTDIHAQLLRMLREETLQSTSAIGPHTEDNLMEIKGIGEGYAGMLNAAGVHTFRQLSFMTPDDLLEILRAPHWREPNVETWIAEARALAGETGLRSILEQGEEGEEWRYELDELAEGEDDEEPPDDLLSALDE